MSQLSSRKGDVTRFGEYDLEHYARWFESDQVFVADPPQPGPTDARRYRLNPSLGAGWMEIRQIANGLVIGRSSLRMTRQYRYAYEWTPNAAGFGLLVEGSMELRMPGKAWRAEAARSDVLMRVGDLGQGHGVSPSEQVVSGVSIDLPPHMSLAFQEEGVEVFRPGVQLLAPGTGHCAARLRGLASRMLALPTATTTVQRLTQEAMALELLTVVAGLETAKARPYPSHARWRAALDAAIDILHVEWSQPHTITGLARRVGMNECYLKSMFRERTGDSVAGYLRRLRMEHARALIEEQGQSVKEVALQVGYANPSHFAEAFRRVHGVLPSRLRS